MKKIPTIHSETNKNHLLVIEMFKLEKFFSVFLYNESSDHEKIIPLLQSVFKKIKPIAEHFTSADNLSHVFDTKIERDYYTIYERIFDMYFRLFYRAKILVDRSSSDKTEINLSIFKEQFSHFFDFFNPLTTLNKLPFGYNTVLSVAKILLEEDFKKQNELTQETILLFIDKMILSVEGGFKKSHDPYVDEQESRNEFYSLILSYYCLVYQKHQNQDILKKIINNLRKDLKLSSITLLEAINTIAKAPIIHGIIFDCFKRLGEEILDFFINFEESKIDEYNQKVFEDILKKIGRLDKDSLSKLIDIFTGHAFFMSPQSYFALIEIMSKHKNLLTNMQLEKVLRTLIDSGYGFDELAFYKQVLCLANMMDTPDLTLLMSIFKIYIEQLSLESEACIPKELISILLKKQRDPLQIKEWFHLIKQMSGVKKFQPEDTTQLFKNIKDLSEEYADDVIDFCHQYKDQIAQNQCLLAQILSFETNFLIKLENGEWLIQKQKQYQTFQNLAHDACQEIESTKVFQVLHRIQRIFISVIQSFQNNLDILESFDKHQSFIETLRIEFQKLNQISIDATGYETSLKFYLADIEKILQQEKPSIESLGSVIHLCKETVEAEIEKIKEDKSNHLELYEAKRILYEGHYENLLKLNQWLRDPGMNKDLFIMKIECLLKLNYVHQASEWLEKAHHFFSKNLDMHFFILWARTCMQLGQLSTALEVLQFVYEKADKKKNHFLLRIELAICNQRLGRSDNLREALNICRETKLDLIKRQAQVTDPQYQERLSKFIQNISFLEIESLILEGKYQEAKSCIKASSLSLMKKNILFAKSYLAQSKYHQAIKIYKGLLENNFAFIWMKQLLSCYYLEKIFLHEDEINQLMTLFAQNKQEIPEYYQTKISFLKYLKKYDLIFAELETMRKKFGETTYTARKEADIHDLRGDTLQAITTLLNIPNFQNDKLILLKLAIYYPKVNHIRKALEYFELLKTQYPAYLNFYRPAIDFFISVKDTRRVQEYSNQFFELVGHSKNKDIDYIQSIVSSFLGNVPKQKAIQLSETSIQIEKDKHLLQLSAWLESEHCFTFQEQGELEDGMKQTFEVSSLNISSLKIR